MIEYKCWLENYPDESETIKAKTPEDAAAEYAREHVPDNEWPEGWPDEPEWPLNVVVQNFGTFNVWPRTEVVPMSALKEEHRHKYDSVTAVFFYAVRKDE